MRLFVRIRLPFLIAVALSTAASVAAQSGTPAAVTPTVTAESPCTDPANEPQNDWDLMWRLRTDRNLDCITSMIDQRLGKGGSVTLTREELQEIRMRALWARDAAARIGR